MILKRIMVGIIIKKVNTHIESNIKSLELSPIHNLRKFKLIFFFLLKNNYVGNYLKEVKYTIRSGLRLRH